MADKNDINVLIIGLGNHAKNMILPSLKLIKRDINLVGVIELQEKLEYIRKSLLEVGFNNVELIEAQNKFENSEYSLSIQYINKLDMFINKKEIEAVIISINPICQFAYVEWALKRGLHVLCEKPLPMHINSSTNEGQASRIWKDALYLYNSSLKGKSGKGKNSFYVNYTTKI